MQHRLRFALPGSHSNHCAALIRSFNNSLKTSGSANCVSQLRSFRRSSFHSQQGTSMYSPWLLPLLQGDSTQHKKYRLCVSKYVRSKI